MRRWLLLPVLAAVCLPLLTPAPAAADEGWTITAYHSDITVATDATLTVVEDVRVNFAQEHHGIFRTIPIRYRYDDLHDRVYQLNVVSVTDGSQPRPYTTSEQGVDEVIQIGDPDVLVSGDQRYVIAYTVAGAMNAFSDHDELFWNVDGDQWAVPKAEVTATVHLPAGAFEKAACYEGPAGSTATCRSSAAGNDVQYAATRTLAPGEQMSIVAGLNKGVVNVPAPLLDARQRSFPADAFDVNPLTVGASLLVLLLGIGFVAWNWLQHGRDRQYLTQYYLTNDPRESGRPLFKQNPVVVEFEPPSSMRPAELGVILDESADTKDITATIVDLAVRGYLTITEVPGVADWTLTWRARDTAGLMEYEKTILGGLFASGQQVRLSDLRGKFMTTRALSEKQMYADAMARKLFTTNPTQARASWGCLGIGLVIVGIAVSVMLGIAFGWGYVGVALALVGIAMTISFPFMPQRTATGRELMQRTLGFRLYMTTAEKYRQQFAAKADIFTQLLPYAIVFGCVTMWAKAFEGIDTSTANGWYIGNAPFQAALLANSLQAMNYSISNTVSYTPPSSGSGSGFGGGGFSGGGGGGGGGGAW